MAVAGVVVVVDAGDVAVVVLGVGVMSTLLGSASNLYRTLECPAANLLPQDTSRPAYVKAAADLGTKLHDEAERSPTKNFAGYYTPPHDREVALVYHGGTKKVSEIPCSRGHRDYGKLEPTDVPGTSDVFIRGWRTLEVVDYKFGKRPVEAIGNVQLLHLALMAHRALSPSATTIVLSIQQQPKGVGPVKNKSWTVDPWTLDEHEDRVQSALKLAVIADKTIKSGKEPDVNPGSWCEYCNARAACPKMGETI